MKSNSKQLLDDLLAEAAPPEFQANALDAMLGHVRARRKRRKLKQAAAMLAVFVSVPFLLWRISVPPPSPAPDLEISSRPAPASFDLIVSQPPDPRMIVETQPDGVRIVSTAPGTVQIVHTQPDASLFNEIDDDQLLRLLAGRGATLIRTGPGAAELFFVEPVDRNGFPLH